MFLGVSAKAGEAVRTRVPIGELADGTPVAIPVAVIRGTRPGPTMYVQAGLHGDEMTGIEIARQVLPLLDPKKVIGTIVCVPLANVPAHQSRTRGWLHEERWLIDINRTFPGNEHGLMSERIAHVLFNEFVVPSDLTLDLHAALDGCDIAPFVYIDPYDDEEGTLELRERVGTAFGTPFVYHKARGEKLGTSDMTRALRNQASLVKRPSLSAEMGESRRVSWEHLPMAVKGLQNAMRAFGVLEGDVTPPPKQRVFTKISLVHAEHGGGLRMPVKLGQDVKKGEELATIVDVFGETVERAVSPLDGFVLRKMLFGSVATGGELAWIGS